MDYNLKADLTTLLSTYLIPILVGYGFSSETSNAVVGIVVALIIIGFNMLNERYTSTHLTKECECQEEVEELGSDSDMA